MWFFRKKKEDERWSTLQTTLKNSFFNIKRDMTQLRNKEEEQDAIIREIQTKLAVLDGKIENLSQIKIQPILKEQEIEQEIIPQSVKDIYNNLTNTHKSLLLQLSLLLKESSTDWIMMKFLTQELYPHKKYESVKSMISDYTDHLLNLGLIEKKRKGRQILLSITEKGYACLPKQVKPIKKKIKE